MGKGHETIKLEDIQTAVDGPATLVKARGMNHHKHILFNALNMYLSDTTNEDLQLNNEVIKWIRSESGHDHQQGRSMTFANSTTVVGDRPTVI